jgi:hypothetical protein
MTNKVPHARSTVNGYTVSGEMGTSIASSQQPEAILRVTIKLSEHASLFPLSSSSGILKQVQDDDVGNL